MFGSRRLAKRSIVGTRVAALSQDGRYHPGMIQAQSLDSGSPADSVYTVRFDDGKLWEVRGLDIVGPGFQVVTSSKLKKGQKVYITLNGRETTGLVTQQVLDEVTVSVKAATGNEVVLRRPDEIRLMESRKSARLLDQDTDYSLMADLQITEPKKRTVSHVIDVPSKHTERVGGGRTRGAADFREEEMDTVGELSMFGPERAAQVLSSMTDGSTFGTGWITRGSEFARLLSGDSALSSSVASSGFCSGQSEGGPSPPLNPPLSTSMDDGINLQDSVENYIYDTSPRQADDEPNNGYKNDEPSDELGDYKNDEPSDEPSDELSDELGDYKSDEPSEGFRKCLAPSQRGQGQCGQLFRTEKEAISHLSLCHFNGKKVPKLELDFYIDDVGDVTDAFAQMSTASSPPSSLSTFANGGSPLPSSHDHDYQRKERCQPPVLMASSVPVGSGMAIPSPSTPIPISMPEGHITRSLSWQPSTSPSALPHLGLSPLRSSPSMHERLQQHQALSPKSHLSSPPKSVMASRKPRSEGSAKCRKVFGTDKKDQWCTQCRWKKACSRYT